MENNYYKLLNFVTKLSQPKLGVQALNTLNNRDENHGSSAVEIFEDGIDNAEAIIAIEARKLLETLKTGGGFNFSTKVVEKVLIKINSEDEPDLKKVEDSHIKYWLSKNNGNKIKTAKNLGISVKTLYNRVESLKKQDVNL